MYYSEFLIKLQNLSLTKMHSIISSAKWRRFSSEGDGLMMGWGPVFLTDVLHLNG